jgi:predicted glycosyltransferase
MKALIYVQHLLGTGHVVRAAALARALAARDVETVLVSGNRVPPTVDTGGFQVVELPAARSADENFSAVVDEGGRPIDDAWKARRLAQLLSVFDETAPDIVVTETWPFGRNAFAFEAQPLNEATRQLVPRPIVAVSVRDILVRKNDEAKEGRMASRARAGYDMVLVHGDPAFVRFEDSFPLAAEIGDLIRYTGYIDTGADTPEPPPGDGVDEVIVSCGGGAVGAALLETALAARALSKRACDTRWRLLVGTDLDDLVLADLKTRAGEGIVVERARRDFPGILKRARLSVSQCGYNTAVDVLAAGCAAVFVPFARGAETEQTQRAEALAARGLAAVVPEAGLTPQRLADAIDAALALPPAKMTLDRDGARTSAGLLIDAVNTQRGKTA